MILLHINRKGLKAIRSIADRNRRPCLGLDASNKGARRKKKQDSDSLVVASGECRHKATRILRCKVVESERSDTIAPSKILFCDYVSDWLEQIARKVDAVTFQGYKHTAEKHIIPYFEKEKLALVDVDHNVIQRYMDSKHLDGRLDGKGGLSPRSLRAHKNVISQALNEAVKNKLISINPCQFVILPMMVRYESTFYNESQLQALFEAIRDDPLFPLVKITALYGLRRSELLGLQWDSIDFEAKTMTIRHTVSKVTKVVAKDKTKNASSHRTFPLSTEALEIFKAAKAQERHNQRILGSKYQKNNYVFKWADGHVYSPDYISRRFRLLLEKHNLPHIRFHELRHSCASVLIAMGWTLKDIQEWLGHSDIQTTANIYSHIDLSRKNQIVQALSAKF